MTDTAASSLKIRCLRVVQRPIRKNSLIFSVQKFLSDTSKITSALKQYIILEGVAASNNTFPPRKKKLPTIFLIYFVLQDIICSIVHLYLINLYPIN